MQTLFTIDWPLTIKSEEHGHCLNVGRLSCLLPVLNMVKDGIGVLQNVTSERYLDVYVQKLVAVSPPSAGTLEQLTRFVDQIVVKSYKDPVMLLPRLITLTSVVLTEATQLQHFAAGLNRHLETLAIDKCMLQHVPAAIANLTRLTSLVITNCRISELRLDSLARNSMLSSLVLRFNRIKLLQTSGNVPKAIQSLELTDNELPGLNLSVFASLNQLTLLNLSRNRLTVITPAPRGALVFAALERLYLDFCNLTEATIQHFAGPKVQALSIRGNLLATMPALHANFSALQTLTVERNAIATIDLHLLDGLQSLTNVWMGLMGARAIRISKPIRLPSFEMLSLEANQLRSVNLTGCDFPNLLTIDLKVNRLTALPDLSQQFPKLQTVVLTNNPLRCSFVHQFQDQIRSNFMITSSASAIARCTTNASLDIVEDFATCCNN